MLSALYLACVIVLYLTCLLSEVCFREKSQLTLICQPNSGFRFFFCCGSSLCFHICIHTSSAVQWCSTGRSPSSLAYLCCSQAWDIDSMCTHLVTRCSKAQKLHRVQFGCGYDCRQHLQVLQLWKVHANSHFHSICPSGLSGRAY